MLSISPLPAGWAETSLRIASILFHRNGITVSERTIRGQLRRAGLHREALELSISGTATIRPETHVAFFAGGIPCDNRGNQLSKIINSISQNRLADGLTADCTFSSKPPDGYPDYHAKMTAYANMITGWAQAIDPNVTARSMVPVKMTEDESVFRYLDTASSRAQISLITSRLALPKVALVGVGGTGGYVLDQVAKTPVSEIHLFDGDLFYAHNAFRAPGAASIEDRARGHADLNPRGQFRSWLPGCSRRQI